MSTRLYLVCLSHDPPIASQSEVGYQLRHLPAVRGYVADRSVLAAAVEAGADEFGDQFRTTAAWFLWRHPGCRIGIRDALGGDYSLTDEAVAGSRVVAVDPTPSGERGGIVGAGLTGDGVIVLDGEYPAEVLENNVYADLFRDRAAFRVCPPPAEDGGPSGEAVEAAGGFMAAMEAEERWRSSLPPVGSAVEWERASDGGGAPIALVVVEGPSAGAVVALDRPSLVIGRAEGCDVRLADELVSPRHARLSCEALDGRWPAGRWVIEDLGSVNGVFVGGTRAFVGLPVSAGVRVQVGGSVFVLR